MRLFDLFEARKNPEQNPKTDPMVAIRNFMSKADGEVGGATNVFISMTSVDKLGVFPRSTYNTPLGIYAYTSDYAEEQAKAGFADLPFVGDAPYINVFSVKGNVINLNELSESDYNKYIGKMVEVFLSKTDDSARMKIFAEDKVKTAKTYAKFNSFGGMLWYVAKELSQKLGEIRQPERFDDEAEEDDGSEAARPMARRSAIAWNTLMRESGIDGAVDHGEGIIHTNEPDQAVFFNTQAIKLLDRIPNRYDRAWRAETSARRRDEELLPAFIDYLKTNELIKREIVSEVKTMIRDNETAQRLDMVIFRAFRKFREQTSAERFYRAPGFAEVMPYIGLSTGLIVKILMESSILPNEMNGKVPRSLKTPEIIAAVKEQYGNSQNGFRFLLSVNQVGVEDVFKFNSGPFAHSIAVPVPSHMTYDYYRLAKKNGNMKVLPAIQKIPDDIVMDMMVSGYAREVVQFTKALPKYKDAATIIDHKNKGTLEAYMRTKASRKLPIYPEQLGVLDRYGRLTGNPTFANDMVQLYQQFSVG